MKNCRVLWILTLLFVPFLIFAQLPCGKTDISYQEELIAQKLIQQYNPYSKQSRVAYTTMYIAVKPHFVRTDAGITTLNMAAFNNALAICNQYFINAGIQFYVCGTPTNTPNYINNTAMYDWNTANFNRDAITAANNINNAHNIYFSNSLGGAGGFSFGMTQSKVNNRTFVLNGQADDSKTLAHELGHYFNLAHTFNNADATNISSRELVTRNASEVAPRLPANCTTAGDFVCDTPADPYNLTGGYLSSCNSSGTGITALDANGDPFVPSHLNVMNYYFCSPYLFSTGQYARMNAALAVNNTPNPTVSDRYTLDCAETNQNAPTNVILTSLVTGVSLGVTVSWTDNSTNETGFIIERSTTSSTAGFVAIGGVDANILSFTDKKISRSTTYYYRVKASNTKTKYNITIPNITTPLICGPLHTSACVANGNINIFKILNGTTVVLDKSNSACSANSYGDFTAMTAPAMLAGKTYSFIMKTGYPGGTGYVPQHLGIWIDANQDNDFDDLGEIVYQSSGSGIMSGTIQLDGNFTVPPTAKVGNLRMRVRSISQYEGIVTSPCNAQDSGETEDYLIAVGRSISVNNNLPSICPSSPTGSLIFIPNYVPNSGNSYSVELSDNTGMFGTTPLVVGTGTGSTSPISIAIPNTVTAGSAYRFRVKGSNPVVVGNESNNFGYGVSSATLSLVGKNTIAVGDSSLLRITFTGARPYGFILSNGKTVSNITTDTYDIYVKPIISTTYNVTSATGGCGNATTSGSVYVGVSPYCIPTYTTPCSPNNNSSPQLAINRLELLKGSTTIIFDNNNSNCSAANYSDFTNLTAPLLKRDSTYSVVVAGHISTGGSYYPMYYSVWIDYNRNNNFNDVGELVWTSTTSDNIESGTFVVPLSALSGNLRMRVRSLYGAAPTDPCMGYSYGEAEDYLVNIEALSSVGGSVAGSTRICPNRNNNTLTLSGHNGNIVKWQSSTNATFSPVADIANTTTTLITSNLPTTTYYRAVVQSGTSPIANSNYAVLTVTPNTPLTLAQSTVNMNYGVPATLTASGCLGTLLWYKSNGNMATMPVSPTCSDRYFAHCEETNGTEKCLTGTSPILTVKVLPSGSELTSIASGNWESSSTWNIGRSPQNGDLVIIRSNDTVFITTNTAQARCLEMSGFNSIQYTTPSSKISLGF